MNSEQVYEKLSGIMRKVFKDEGLVAQPAMTATDVKGWDSLAHIRLVLEVERGFRVKFATAEIGRFGNIGELANMIEQKLGQS
jgi:acyl carrier protein